MEAAKRIKAFLSDKRTWGVAIGVVVIAIIAFAFFYPDAAEGNVLRQHDMQQGIANGQEAKAFTEATGETTRWTNSLFGGMPTFQIAPAYASNALFTWLNTVMGLGLPSPANLLAMMMLGFFILLLAMRMKWPVALLGAVAYGFSSYFVIIIGAGHIWKFVTLAYIPPTLAGVVLAYRGRYLAGAAVAGLFAMLQIASNHVQMTYYFLPVVIGFIIIALCKALREKQMRQWWIATGTLVVAAALAVGANLPSLYNTMAYSKETMRGGHSELTKAEGTTTGGGLDKDYITQYSYAPSETFSLLIPNIKGGASAKPEKGSMTIMSLDKLDGAKADISSGKIDPMTAQYLSYMSQYFGDPEGTNGPVYVGALVFALFLLGCIVVKGPAKWVLLVLTVLSIGLAWGRHMMWLTDLAINIVPMYSKFRTVESILVVAEFCIPLLAIMGLNTVVNNAEDAWTAYRKPLLWSFGIAGALCLLAILAPGIYGSPISENDRMIDQMIGEQLAAQGYDSQTAAQFSLQSPAIYKAVTELREGMVRSDATRSLVIVALGFGVMLLYMRRRIGATLALAGIGVIVAGDLLSVNKRYLDHESFVSRQLTVGAPIEAYPADRMILQDTTMNYRVMDLARFNMADPSYYHKMIGGYHAAKLSRYQDLIDAHLSHFQTGQTTDADINVLNMLNARYVVTDPNAEPLLNDEAYGNAWLVDKVKYVTDANNEMAALSHLDLTKEAVADARFHTILGESRPKSAGDTIFETTYAPNRLTYHVNTKQGGVAVFSEVYFPWGWHATIDGEPATLGRVNYVLRALDIPAGSHTVEMTFNPESIRVTETVATVSVILIYLLAAGAIVCAVAGCKCKDA